ncbi:outer membrane lipoprotein-sorting protein [Anaeromyxobacter oryzisoli]|uniref:outer membrane lipoprotein-sorting protein n=1 Tax=Anaeromyxobacter oryzisoli TaxID=2925408 RepID=UPI001F5642D1|nr:outer membrane lipoprotein-sorting protein [Anaeromyxobacter sp. SG63]
MRARHAFRAAIPMSIALGLAAPAIGATAQESPGAAVRGSQAPTADALVRALEKLMYPDARTTLRLRFRSSEGRDEQYEMVCYTRERNGKIIVRMAAPAEQIGNDILMLDQNVWTYDRAANRVIKVASNQSFGGTGFSYGDVVRLNFSSNYDAALEGETPDTYLLELTAKHRNAPYYRIALTVAKRGGWPVSGTYYAQSGSVVKEITYSDIRDTGFGRKPVTLTVRTPLDPGSVNVMSVVREESKDLPDRIFNKRNLETRLEEKL